LQSASAAEVDDNDADDDDDDGSGGIDGSRVVNTVVLVLLPVVSAILFEYDASIGDNYSMHNRNGYRQYFFTYCLVIFDNNTFAVGYAR